MFHKLKNSMIAIFVLGLSTSASTTFATNQQIQPNHSIQVNCQQSQIQTIYCALHPEACQPQTCGSLQVNTVHSTCGCNIALGYCGLDAAIALANSCSTPTTITFDSSLSGQTIDLSGFAAPLGIAGKDVTLDGGTSSMTVQAKAGKAAFLMEGQNPLIRNILFRAATVAPIQIGSTAVNADVRNVRTYESGVPLLESEAADSSDTNVPVMVLPGSTATEYVVFAILPVDSQADADKLRFCETSSQSSHDCLNLEVTGTSFLPDPLKDPAGNITDTTKYILEITVSGVDATKNYMAFVKNFGKSVAIADLKSGLAPFYIDSDKDLLRDIDETTYFMTDASKLDTDGDTLSDFYNMIGQPGQPTPQSSGALVYPAANVNGFLPGNYKLATEASQAESPASVGGCSMTFGDGGSITYSALALSCSFFTLMVLGWKRNRVSRK